MYKWMEPLMYVESMDVPVTELRAHLSEWLDRVRGGEEVIVTDRGVPVAKMLGMSATATLQRLAADGVIGRDTSARRPMATGRPRPRPRRPVSGIVSEQRE
jgi:prevent-host-death family protein